MFTFQWRKIKVSPSMKRRSIKLFTAIGIYLFWYLIVLDLWHDLNALPMSKYAWPLVVDVQQVIREYRSGNWTIKPITWEHHSKIIRYPSRRYCSKEIRLVTVLIKTRVDDIYNRKVLRKTWIQDLYKNEMQHGFLVGRCKSPSCQSSLEDEAAVHQDIIQGDFIDAYYNNTKKFSMGLQYAAYHCNATRYLLVLDGDYALNAKRLAEYLKELRYPKDLYAGNIHFSARPFRSWGHAQGVSYEFYPYRRYPPFASAGGSLMSTEIAEPMFIVGHYTKYIEFDDVFYGFVAKKLGINLVDASDELPSYWTPIVKDYDAHRRIVGSHRFDKLDEVRQIYDIIHHKDSS